MRSIQIVFVSAFLLSGAQAFAAPHGNGPCAAYVATCKSDASVTGATDKKAKWEAMSSCVAKAAAADGDKGKACQDAQARMEKMHMMHKNGAQGASTPAPANTAPAGN